MKRKQKFLFAGVFVIALAFLLSVPAGPVLASKKAPELKKATSSTNAFFSKIKDKNKNKKNKVKKNILKQKPSQPINLSGVIKERKDDQIIISLKNNLEKKKFKNLPNELTINLSSLKNKKATTTPVFLINSLVRIKATIAKDGAIKILKIK